MVYRDPVSGIVYDDMPWKPKHDHHLYRILLTDYEWLCLPPNAVVIDPPGWPYSRSDRISSGIGAAGIPNAVPIAVFVTLPWTRDGLSMAQGFWRVTSHWLGDVAYQSVTAQIDLALRELDRRAADEAMAQEEDAAEVTRIVGAELPR